MLSIHIHGTIIDSLPASSTDNTQYTCLRVLMINKLPNFVMDCACSCILRFSLIFRKKEEYIYIFCLDCILLRLFLGFFFFFHFYLYLFFFSFFRLFFIGLFCTSLLFLDKSCSVAENRPYRFLFCRSNAFSPAFCIPQSHWVQLLSRTFSFALLSPARLCHYYVIIIIVIQKTE